VEEDHINKSEDEGGRIIRRGGGRGGGSGGGGGGCGIPYNHSRGESVQRAHT